MVVQLLVQEQYYFVVVVDLGPRVAADHFLLYGVGWQLVDDRCRRSCGERSHSSNGSASLYGKGERTESRSRYTAPSRAR